MIAFATLTILIDRRNRK
ncbi:hypothetical protein L3V66_07655 [Secundilactobacillus sp. HBUAS58055]|nr:MULTISPECIES: hypothetical protein [Secundilactobacillus]MCH5462646.1 hypothetical protein [Secundilactobacillus angelensis]